VHASILHNHYTAPMKASCGVPLPARQCPKPSSCTQLPPTIITTAGARGAWVEGHERGTGTAIAGDGTMSESALENQQRIMQTVGRAVIQLR